MLRPGQPIRLATFTFGLLAAALCVAPVPAVVISWDGQCGNNFWASTCNPGSHTNWNPDGMPTANDAVSANALVTMFGGLGEASTVSFTTGLSITNGGELRISGTGGSITNLSLTNSSVNVQNGILEIDGNSISNGGAVFGDGELVNIGTLTGLSLAVKNVANHPGTFTNALGNTTLSVISTEPGTTVNNANGTLTLIPNQQTSGGAIGSHGIFTNAGNFITQHTGSTFSSFMILCSMFQGDGSFRVQGQSTAFGTVLSGGALFTGGDIIVNDDANLRFQTGAGGTYEFDGLSGITGSGNTYVQLGPFVGPDWRVLSDLNVNLTGSSGFVLESGNMTLTGVLTSQGNARWAGGTIRPNTGCGVCSPEYRNQGNLTIATGGSSVTLNTWLRNNPGASIMHTTGSLGIGDSGLVTNHGSYEQRRGTINRAGPTMQFGSFDNRGTYVRPDHPDTQDVQNGAAFVLNPVSVSRFEKSQTTFAGQIGSGVFFLGGNMEIHDTALVRVGGGSCEQADSFISGQGQFHFGNPPGVITFLIEQGRVLFGSLGPNGGDGGGETGGVYLGNGGRIGGLGELRNLNQLFWNGGSIGINGSGRVRNTPLGTTFLTSGTVNSGGDFVNDGPPGFPEDGFFPDGLVKQNGVLSLNSGFVHNDGTWRIETGSTIQGSGTGEFFNGEDGIFRNVIPPTQMTTVNARFNNSGRVVAESGTLAFSNVAQVSGGTLSGGRWEVDPGATLDLPGTLLVIGPGAHVVNNGTFNDLNTLLVNAGELIIHGQSFGQGLTNNGLMGLNGSGGTTQIQGGNGNLDNGAPGGGSNILKFLDEYTAPVFAPPEGGGLPFALRCANLNNRGTVRPGGAGAPGPFKMDGNFIQAAPEAVLQIELAGLAPVDGHDQLIVDGNVLLDGHLQVRVLPGYFPDGGEEFTIITATNGVVAGAFDSIDGPGQYSLSYSPTSVTLTLINAPHPGDVTGDGITNINDLLAVIVGWGACPAPPTFCAADLTGDGIVNVDDLLVVVVNWG